jgi:protein gp37
MTEIVPPAILKYLKSQPLSIEEIDVQYKDYVKKIKNFEPVFIPYRMKQAMPKSARVVFMNSMSDIQYWSMDWGTEACKYMMRYRGPHWVYLTKSHNPETLSWIANHFYDNLDPDIKVSFGVTVDDPQMCDPDTVTLCADAIKQYKFGAILNFEPLLSNPSMFLDSQGIGAWDHIIIGAETGNSLGFVSPKTEWIDYVKYRCEASNVKLFEKDSLKNIITTRTLVQQPL